MGLTSVPLLRDVTPVSDSAASLRWFFKVDVDQVEEILFFEIASSSKSRSASAANSMSTAPLSMRSAM